MKTISFELGEVVAIDEEIGTIVELYGLKAEGKDNVYEMAKVKLSYGEIHDYLLVDLGKIVNNKVDST